MTFHASKPQPLKPRAAALSLLCLAVTFFSVSANALTPNVAQLVQWETKSNAIATRSSSAFELEHFEIPLSEVEATTFDHLEPEVRKSLIFSKDGKHYVRWIINPEDTQFSVELEKYLKQRGLDATKKKHFTAYLTASRSMIISDPETGAEFSAKVSTNATGGEWQNKPLTAGQAKQSVHTTSELKDLRTRIEFQHAIFLDERAIFSIEGAHQGFVVRSLETFHANPSFYYLPGFSAVHEKKGREIAALNGASDVEAFWLKNGVEPIARAQAEFVAFFGRVPEAGHWQNYLIELDKNMKPTGRVVLRDFSDSEPLVQYHKNLINQAALEWWPKNHIVDKITLASGPFKGNLLPDWVQRADLHKWHDAFFSAFEAEFAKITGLHSNDFDFENVVNDAVRGMQWGHTYYVSAPSWDRFFGWIECYRGHLATSKGVRCPPEIRNRIASYSLADKRCAELLRKYGIEPPVR